MRTHYHRLWIRFEDAENKRRLAQLQLEMIQKTGRHLTKSQIVEQIVVQFLDRHFIPGSSLQET